MQRRQTPRDARTTMWWIMRSVWGVLAAVHLWPLAAVGWRFCLAPTVDEALVLFSLLGVLSLFGWKAVDGRWLRFHRPGIELTALVLAAALVHGDADRSHEMPVLAVEAMTSAAAVASVAAASSRRVRRRFVELLRGLSRTARGTCGASLRVGVVELLAWRRPVWRLCHAVSARGPPCRVW